MKGKTCLGCLINLICIPVLLFFVGCCVYACATERARALFIMVPVCLILAAICWGGFRLIRGPRQSKADSQETIYRQTHRADIGNRCPECGGRNPAGLRKCELCGVKLRQ